MAERFDLIVFDWDGTLLDSAAAIVRAIQGASRDLGLPAPSDERARHVIGLGLTDALAFAVPELSEADYPRMVERYRHHYLSSDHELNLFAGTEAMIATLVERGHLLGVATGKSRAGLDRALSHTGLGAHFLATRCADECHSKPHPQMLHELMVELGTAPERTLMIGDTPHDLQMAEAAGVAALAVTFGAHPADVLRRHEALAYIERPEDLGPWLAANA